jgi:hypothetical protein
MQRKNRPSLLRVERLEERCLLSASHPMGPVVLHLGRTAPMSATSAVIAPTAIPAATAQVVYGPTLPTSLLALRLGRPASNPTGLGSGTLTLSGDMHTGGTTVTTGTLTLGGTLNGVNTNVGGTSCLTITGGNAYTGGTTCGAGRLIINNGNAISGGTTSVLQANPGSSLSIGSGSTQISSGALGTLNTNQFPGTLVLNGAVNGGTTANSGTLNLGSSTTVASTPASNADSP